MNSAIVFALFFSAVVMAQETIPTEESSATAAPASAKRRQFIAAAPQVVVAPPPVVVTPVGQCPGGPSLPIECDPKRPWPACPPQSYCYATNSVDIGPYFCCPVWSTYGAAWRPAGPLSDYVPPMPLNWPEEVRRTAAWPAAAINYAPVIARPLRKKTEQKFEHVDAEDAEKIETSLNGWLDRRAKMA